MSTSTPDPSASAESAPSPEPSDDAPVARVVDVADTSRVRRAPRYGRFGFAGLLLGAALALGLTFVPADLQISRGDLFLLLLLGLGTAGIFAGLTWALVSDRRSLRRRGK